METKTEKGLKFLNYGLILYIISALILFMILLAFLPTILEFDPDAEEEEVEEALGPIVGALLGLCLAGGIMIIAIILLLVGFVFILIGREEFGKEHSDYMMKALILFIVGIVINFIASGVSVFSGPAGTAIGIGTAICFAIGGFFLIYHISDEKGRKILKAAMVLYIVLSIVSVIITIWLFTSLDLYEAQGAGFDTTTEDSVDSDKAMAALMISFGLGSLGLLPVLIYFLAYRRAYFRVKTRQIQPVIPAYAPVPPQPYPPAYPPQYPPQYPPAYPQQYPPPQPPAYPPPQQAQGYPAPQPVQPVVVARPQPTTPPATTPGVKRCAFCGSEIPASSTTCPVCKKSLQ